MQRYKIKLGNDSYNHIYLVDRYVSKELLPKVKKQFIMLRRYDYIDQLTFDTDVYIIEKSIYDDWKNGEATIAFPNTYTDSTKYATMNFYNKIEKFNDSFLYNEEDMQPIMDENGEIAHISCDLIRIYHPNTKINQKYLIYIDSYINSIHFHFYCRPNIEFDTHAEQEISLDNLYYSEYIEFYIPNIEEIFNNTYYSDVLNIIEGMDPSCVPMTLFKTPFKIEDEEGNFSKIYIDESEKLYCEDSSKFTNNLNITLYPYIGIDDITGMYLFDEDLNPNGVIYTNNVNFRLKAKFVLDEVPKLVCTFELPENSVKDNFRDAYQYYNNVSIDEYKGITYEASDEDDEYVHEEYGDVDGQEMKLCGYQLLIATDNLFKTIIYDETNWDTDFDDFSFNLNGIFSTWNQYQEIIICKAKFYDRYLGNVIESNEVMITKEQFKYLINELPYTHRIKYPTIVKAAPEGYEVLKSKMGDFHENFLGKINDAYEYIFVLENHESEKANAEFDISNQAKLQIIYNEDKSLTFICQYQGDINPIIHYVVDDENNADRFLYLTKKEEQFIGTTIDKFEKKTKFEELTLSIDGILSEQEINYVVGIS